MPRLSIVAVECVRLVTRKADGVSAGRFVHELSYECPRGREASHAWAAYLYSILLHKNVMVTNKPLSFHEFDIEFTCSAFQVFRQQN